MVSMTGYGYAEMLNENFFLSVEVKGCNSRFLDINHTMPSLFSSYEQAIDERLKKAALRGHIDVTVHLRQLKSDVELTVDEGAVRQYRQAYEHISRVASLERGAELSDYLAAEGVLITLRTSDAEQFAQPLFALLDQALTDFSASKRREGEATKNDLKRLGDQVQEQIIIIEGYAQTLEQKVKETLLAKFEELLAAYDENRFYQEVAILLAKYSVNEEIMRLKAHLEAFRSFLECEEPVGKRIDFLSQEMNREINTIGSKSIIVQINQQVVALKDSLENIREQARNVE